MRCSGCVCVVALMALAGAGSRSAAQVQGTAARIEAEPVASFGSVTGHVYLVGSNAPARFARVALQPFDVKDPPQGAPGKTVPVPFTIYQTDLNGGFRIDHVRAGMYYVVVNSPGCLSPFATFTKEELQNPSPEVAARIASAVPAVSVRPNATADVTLRLQKGAALSGVVRFDDGTPFAEAYVLVNKRGPDGKWTQPRATEAGTVTDTDGHWAIHGLPAGDYRLQVNLAVEERHQSALLGDNQSSWNNTKMSMPVYLGDTTRQRDAKVVTLEAGQQMDAEDITAPVSKMHTITGALVDAKTGQSLNAGHVSLEYADDGKEIVSTSIDSESRTFTLPFVMEGEYKLTSKDAHEARFEQMGDPDNDPFHQNRKEITVRQYAPGEMPLVVQGDMSAVNLAVEAKPAKGQ